MKKMSKILGLMIFIFFLLITGCDSEHLGDKYQFTINYETKGIGEISSEKFDINTEVTLPLPSQDDYIFIGWYKDSAFTDGPYTKYKGENNASITFYAKWQTVEEYELIRKTLLVSEIYDLIKSIPENLHLSDQETIKEAREKYDSLDEEFQERIINYDKLVQAELRFENYLYKIEKAARKFDDKVDELPRVVSHLNVELLNEISEIYQGLTSDERSIVKKYTYYKNAVDKIKELENDKNHITYVLGDYVYESKHDLYVAFFTEYYYFILDNYGDEVFKNNKINTLDDFLKLGLDYDAGRGQMRALGDNFGWYFLEKDLNGALEDQTKDKFLGYCYKNNKFIEFINAYTTFFSYWRIDEGYAKKTNYGADMFAESWAPVVDLCKYFYFSASTSYVKSDRVLDYFNNPTGVAFGDFDEEIKVGMTLPTPTLRGYRFVGWYDNKDFNGEAITTIQSTNEKVVLYAKWEEDLYQQSVDAAALVDVYINNLLTNVADASSENIYIASSMYERLSSFAKPYVKYYNDLKRLLAE